MSDQKKLVGGCLCGAIRYKATGTPGLTAICHCHMCQRATGGPFMALLFMPSDTVKVTKGEPRIYTLRQRPTATSAELAGRPVLRAAHPRADRNHCGVPRRAYDFKPQMHLCMESAMAWLDLRDDAPRHARKPEGMTPLVDYDRAGGDMQCRIARPQCMTSDILARMSAASAD